MWGATGAGTLEAMASTPDPFGEHPATRWGADVRYEGTVGRHDYVVEVRHRPVDSTAEIIVDGVRHVPAEEKKAAKAERAEDVGTEDGLAVRWPDGLRTFRAVVRRPTVQGEMKDRESIVIRTRGLGGTGEVDVRASGGVTESPLAPEPGSPSAAREDRKALHPVRFALVAAAGTAAKYLIPLLGLGALFSGLLDPIEREVERRVRPAVSWIAEVTRPVREAIGEVLEPVGRFLGWLRELLLGWIPHLGFSVPSWIVEVALPVTVVLLVFAGTIGRIRHRREKLASARAGRTGADGNSVSPGRHDDEAEQEGRGVDDEEPAPHERT